MLNTINRDDSTDREVRAHTRPRATRRDTGTRAIRVALLVSAMMLAVAACSGSSSSGSTAAPATGGGPSVSIAGFAFAPATITVPVGASITWTNSDSAGHTVTADDGSFKSGTLTTGATFKQTFAAAGTYTYHCSIHASMVGTVTVG